MNSNNRPKPQVKPVFDSWTEIDPFIFEGEDPEHYRDLMRRFHDAYGPADPVEEMLVNAGVQNHWNAMRDRRYELKFTASCRSEGLAALLGTLPMEDVERQELVDSFAAGDEQAIAQVTAVLADAGHDLETVMARTMALRSVDIAAFHTRIAAAEKRRDKSLRDLEDRRARRDRDERRKSADRRQNDE